MKQETIKNCDWKNLVEDITWNTEMYMYDSTNTDFRETDRIWIGVNLLTVGIADKKVIHVRWKQIMKEDGERVPKFPFTPKTQN